METVLTEIKNRFPDVIVNIDPPEGSGKTYWYDIKKGNWLVAIVEWRPNQGFGLYYQVLENYGDGTDEFYKDEGKLLERLIQLLSSE